MQDKARLAFVIEDDEDLSVIFDEAVRQAGFETLPIRDGNEAMQALQTGTPDLVVLDLQLPRISGADILKYMRSDDRLKSCPVIIVTAHPDVALSLHEQVDLVVTKPASFAQVRALVARFLEDMNRG